MQDDWRSLRKLSYLLPITGILMFSIVAFISYSIGTEFVVHLEFLVIIFAALGVLIVIIGMLLLKNRL